MVRITKEELLEKIFHKEYSQLVGTDLRMTRMRVPGREVCLAHVLTPIHRSIYENLGLHIGVHEGEDHMGETIGLMRFTPWEAAIAAADVAVKSSDVQIGFMDRFCGSLIITGERAQVETAVTDVVRFFEEELQFETCKIVKS